MIKPDSSRGLALNGWQRIKRVDGNSLMSWGTQIQFKPSPKLLLNYSTFIGTDSPDSARLIRLFNNLYGIFNLSSRMYITAGIDIGIEDNSPDRNEKNTWLTPLLLVRYMLSDKWAVAGRAEYYSDPNGVIINTGSPNGFKTMGISLNMDYWPTKNVLLRLEMRNLKSKDNIFLKEGTAKDNNAFISSSIAVSL